MHLGGPCQFPSSVFYEKHNKFKNWLTIFVRANSICFPIVDKQGENIHETRGSDRFFTLFLWDLYETNHIFFVLT